MSYTLFRYLHRFYFFIYYSSIAIYDIFYAFILTVYIHLVNTAVAYLLIKKCYIGLPYCYNKI